tara:strand:- start:163 stop:447 length:285 start_codon:yes stop_codon:yes gene_type:complete
MAKKLIKKQTGGSESQTVKEARIEGRKNVRATRELKRKMVKEGKVSRKTGRKWIKQSKLSKKQSILNAKVNKLYPGQYKEGGFLEPKIPNLDDL